jgi:hypothetical protein
MSKCRPDCCSGSNGEGSAAAIIGIIVLVAAVYGIIRAIVHAAEAIMHTVIEVVEITAVTAASIAVVVLAAVITVRIVRFRRRQQRTGLKVISIDLADSPATHIQASENSNLNAAEMFAEAVASPDMDPRFIEKILRNALERSEP